MKTIKNFTYTFIKSNKVNKSLFWGVVFAIGISVSYELTNGFPEWFKGADIIYRYFSQLGFAFVCSFIFYIISVYIPATVKELKSFTINFVYCKEILATWDDIIKSIYLSMGENIDYITLDKIDPCQITEKINFSYVLDKELNI